MSKSLLLKPRLSEKAYALSETANTYIFDVPRSANSHTVAKAVEDQYQVSVIKVRVASIPGKTGRSVRRGRIVGQTKRADIRKAYVTLKQGDKLPLFAAEDESSKEKK